MPRKKVNLKWISNNSTRRATYKRHYHGLVKKTSELATLCGINTCVLVYGEGKVEPEVWPSDAEAKILLKKFKNMQELDNLKNTKNQEEFLQNRVFRLREQVSKLEGENCELETSIFLHYYMDGRRPSLIGTTEDKLISLMGMMGIKTGKAKARLQQLVRQGTLQGQPQVLLPQSSSCQQVEVSSYTNTGTQRMPPPEEHPRLQSQD